MLPAALLTTDTSLDEPYQTCLNQIDRLKQYLAKQREKLDTQILKTIANRTSKHARTHLKFRREITTGDRVFALDWSPKHTHYLAVATRAGKLACCNALDGNKFFLIELPSWKVMACSYSPTENYIASGGMNSRVEIYKLPDDYDAISSAFSMSHKDAGASCWDLSHEGYVSCIKAIDPTSCLSASGDQTCRLWDVVKKTQKSVFLGHTGDVQSVALHPRNPCVFLSGSIDGTAKIWDCRIGNKYVQSYKCHNDDINEAEWFPDGNAFATASDDSTLRLVDIRARQQLNKYADDGVYGSVMCCDFSKSGYFLFAGYNEDPHFLVWNTQTGEKEEELECGERVSCVQTSCDGYTVAAGCWSARCKLIC